MRGWRAWISIALLILLGVFAWRLDWAAMLDGLRRANAWLLLAALLFNLMSLALKGARWWVCLRAVGDASFSLVMRATFAGASLNNILIAQGGEAARVLMVSRNSGISAARVGGALAVERTLDGVSYLVLIVRSLWTLELPASIARWRLPATLALAASVIVIALVSARYRKAGRGVALAFVLSLLAWALQVATYFTVARASQLHVSLGASIAAQLAVGLSFLLRATPGNLGVFQAVYAGTLRPFGIPEADAIVTALLIQLVQTVPVTLIGGLLTPRLARDSAARTAAQS
jgi:uncharacterized membrane protein YbhN (UPF0104 family)